MANRYQPLGPEWIITPTWRPQVSRNATVDWRSHARITWNGAGGFSTSSSNDKKKGLKHPTKRDALVRFSVEAPVLSNKLMFCNSIRTKTRTWILSMMINWTASNASCINIAMPKAINEVSNRVRMLCPSVKIRVIYSGYSSIRS